MRRGFLLNRSLSADNKSQRAPKPKSGDEAHGLVDKSRPPAGAAPIPIPTLRTQSISHHEPQLSALTLGTQVTLYVVHLPPPPSGLGSAEHTTTCVLLSGQTPHILAIPGFPCAPAQPAIPRLYDLRPVPSALSASSPGSPVVELGLFAPAVLEPGDLVLSERPLLLTLRALPAGDAPGMRADDLLERVAASMPAREQRAFLGLRNYRARDTRYSRARGIVDTNALGVGALPGYPGDCAVVCELTCRANHSCSPNAVARWDLPSFSIELRARRRILAGEEITISYLPELTLPRATRITLLRESYAFTCACPACSLTGDAHARSDARRAALARHRSLVYDDAQFAEWLAEPGEEGAHKVVAACEAVMAMIDEEGCIEDVVWPVCLHWLCKANSVLGREEEARARARRAAGLARAFTGEDGGWVKVADDPRMTEWWCCRTKQ
ncbi:uncharacterized protein C8Q71DRAFT_438937 [Rhodofomes roseus]|uniref:SET domain-containing protein n=1 Tax=Rhodofomes roseus TaxID=34475 RepID=A0ABQ8KTC8_9APHY|nr:uncharacterized protein C8Q71DRAFT_438937 [Rhodofomes roseus]KAH9841091.1 hypothetical protein C8Q71DRAFT_438937 [Rhodofomes roseus]